jgi:hypothetical protein
MSDLEQVKIKFDILFEKYNIDKNEFFEIEFGSFPNSIAQIISSKTKINVIGAKLKINNQKVSHILKYHGGIIETGRVKERDRNQIPVTKEDFYLIHYILLENDDYQNSDQDQHGNPGIYFIKKINNIQYWVCMTYTTKKDHRIGEIKKRLTVSTMFKKKA